MNIVFVNPPSEKGKYEHEHQSIPKIGIAYMAAFLEKNGIDSTIIDAKYEKLKLEDVMLRIQKENPDIVGISAMTSEIYSAANVAKEAKKMFPKCRTVIGGAHATSIPYETLQEFRDFDILVTGEGERTLLDLVQALGENKPLDNVKGVLFRQDGEVKANPPREWIEDLDELPFPAWHKYPKAPPFFYVLSTRGCPHHCAFCMTILGKKQRKRSPANVVDEIEWLMETYKAEEMNFLDETFTLDRDRSFRLLDMMIERGLNRKMRWIAQTRADTVDEEIFLKLRKAGCYKIEFGVESGNQRILDYIKKGIKIERVEKAVRLAKAAGLKVACSFIIGHPFETRETAQETIDFIVKLNPDIISLGIMVPHPGTRIYEMAKKREGNYRLTSTDWREYVKFGGGGLELENLSRREMEKLQVKSYLSLYIKNRRFFDFVAYAFEHRKQVLATARKLLTV